MNYSLIPAGQVPSLSYREDVSLRSTRALRQSLFGREAAWVHAAGDRATLVHGRREALRLEEVPVDRRAPILKAYLQIAPGARGHVPVDWMWIGCGLEKDAPIEAFQQIAPNHPVFLLIVAVEA